MRVFSQVFGKSCVDAALLNDLITWATIDYGNDNLNELGKGLRSAYRISFIELLELRRVFHDAEKTDLKGIVFKIQLDNLRNIIATNQDPVLAMVLFHEIVGLLCFDSKFFRKIIAAGSAADIKTDLIKNHFPVKESEQIGHYMWPFLQKGSGLETLRQVIHYARWIRPEGRSEVRPEGQVALTQNICWPSVSELEVDAKFFNEYVPPESFKKVFELFVGNYG